ncbi:uncharacterized protein G2W53_034920 [Senna tora]|uniref:Uncharacterized protein n=1 Tax=Senna tora TaxID=362788 RepID=A0A834W3G8_9FABA|nr:uncharacterized protein G2W53_034920 [Senna tora]
MRKDKASIEEGPNADSVVVTKHSS